MFHLFRKTKINPGTEKYDPNIQKPVLRCSICTGEQVAGFKEPVSGKFHELMLIRDRDDLAEFLSQYQIDEGDIQREW